MKRNINKFFVDNPFQFKNWWRPKRTQSSDLPRLSGVCALTQLTMGPWLFGVKPQNRCVLDSLTE